MDNGESDLCNPVLEVIDGAEWRWQRKSKEELELGKGVFHTLDQLNCVAAINSVGRGEVLAGFDLQGEEVAPSDHAPVHAIVRSLVFLDL